MIVVLGLTLMLTDFTVIVAYRWCEAANLSHFENMRDSSRWRHDFVRSAVCLCLMHSPHMTGKRVS